MTEYDYSPEAMERHLATQQRIARWVDQTHEHSPANPFVPLPGEHTTTTSDVPPHPHPHPQPAYYATPQGVVSPTYSSPRKHGHSQHSSPQSTPVTVPQGYRPVAGTPPTLYRNFYSLPSTPYIPYPTGSPFNPLPYSSPYSSPYQSSPVSHPSYSQSSFHSVPSHIQANPGVPGGNAYFPPQLPPQPVVVVKGKGYVVVSPPGQHVQVISPKAVYEAQNNQGQYFFGRLKGLGMKSSKSKKAKRGRSDSY